MDAYREHTSKGGLILLSLPVDSLFCFKHNKKHPIQVDEVQFLTTMTSLVRVRGV